MKKLFAAFLFSLSLGAGFLQAQESESSRKVEDDMKFNSGMYFMKLGHEEKGLQVLKEYIEIYQNGNHRPEAYMEIARIHFRHFDYQKAADLYTAIYEEFGTRDEGVEGYYHAGICYQKMGYDDKAEEIFRSIMANHGESPHALKARQQIDLIAIINAKVDDKK